MDPVTLALLGGSAALSAAGPVLGGLLGQSQGAKERTATNLGSSDIVSAMASLSLLSRLSEMTFSFSDRKMGINYGLNRVRFTAPVPSGARVRARFTLAKYEPLEDKGVQVTWNVTVEIEGSDKPALVAEWIGRHYYA